MSGISVEKRMTRTGHRDLVALILKEEGPKTSEELKSACGKRGVIVSASSVRKICNDAAEEKTIRRQMLKTPRYRMGVVLWSVLDESAERIDAAKARLEGPAPRMLFGGQGSSVTPPSMVVRAKGDVS
jgi:hypothetical protein